jgi:hypothetical protein
VAGVGTKAFIASRLALEAKRLLVHTEMPISAIAQRLGFDEGDQLHQVLSWHRRMHARRLPPSVGCLVVAAFSAPGLTMLAYAVGTDRNVHSVPVGAGRTLRSIEPELRYLDVCSGVARGSNGSVPQVRAITMQLWQCNTRCAERNLQAAIS